MANQRKKWWSVIANYKSVHIGKSRRRHLWEQIIFLLLASHEQEARDIGAAIAKSKEHSYKTAGGDQIHWLFIEIVGLKELIDQKIIPGVEVGWKFFERLDSPIAESGD